MKRLAEYSQHFLRSPQLVAELVGRSTIRSTDTVYDIGAGSGIIAASLAQKAAKVVAVEYESQTAKILKKNMERYPNVEVIVADISTLELPTTPYKIVANIPFHLSSVIIQRFINSPQAPEAAYLIVQKQFGKKLEASDPTFFTSQLGMIIGAEYTVKIIKSLKRTDYMPRPAVDTVFVELVKRKSPLVPKGRLDAYRRFTEECFSDPHKLAKMPLEVIGAKPGLSPSRLSLAQWLILFNSQSIY